MRNSEKVASLWQVQALRGAVQLSMCSRHSARYCLVCMYGCARQPRPKRNCAGSKINVKSGNMLCGLQMDLEVDSGSVRNVLVIDFGTSGHLTKGQLQVVPKRGYRR